MSAADGGNRSAVDSLSRVLWSCVFQTPVNHDEELVGLVDWFMDVEPFSVISHEITSC